MRSPTPAIGFYTATHVWGGAETYLRDLLTSERLARRWRVKLFCCHDLPLAGNVEQQGGQVVYLDGAGPAPDRRDGPDGPAVTGRAWRLAAPRPLRLLAGTAGEVRRMAALFHAQPVDLLHFNDTGCQPVLVAARLAGIPCTTGTLHSLPSSDAADTDAVHRGIECAAMRSLSVAIAPSEFSRRAWLRRTRVRPRRIRVIYNGVDAAAFQPAREPEEVRRELGIPAGAHVIGVTARLHPVKGHAHLLRALPRVVRAVPEAHLLLVGDGPERARLERMAAGEGLRDRVHFAGHRSDVADLTQLYDVNVLPSQSESLPYTLIEAMLLGKPAVASRCGGIPELVEDGVNGTLVPPGDEAALAAAITDLLTDPAKAGAYGRAGRRRAEERFTKERMVSETFALYQELLDGRRRGQRRRNG